jgi:UDP-MurNAc hydroxylase
MKIEWVNHASFILEHDGVRLISDPWIDGTAFDHGWKHIVPTEFGHDDFAGITHIWLSHEHPDHFSPKNLQAIPAEVRARITVLYHRGVDHRIGAFCRNAGFQSIHELEPSAWLKLSDDLRVRCEEAGSGDTWLAARSGTETLLNINDSYLAHRWRLERIADMVGGPIDVLLTQFSYANWEGNPEDVQHRRTVAADHLDWMRLQCEVLKPRFVIPFASMVWFCHEENYYLNAEMNTIASSYAYLRDHVDATPVAMVPAETWVVGEPHDSEAALERYEPFYARAAVNPELLTSPPIEEAELARLATRFFKLLRKHNPRWALWLARRLGLLKPARVHVWDHGRSYVLSPERGLERIDLPEVECDVAVGSESLGYMLRFLWGGATLHVNGRFRVPPGGDFRRFSRYLLIANYNNRGWSMLRYLPVLVQRMRDRFQREPAGGGSQRAMG